MTKFMNLVLICASVATLMVAAATATTAVAMDQCTCSCPTKTVAGDSPGAAVAASRRRRQVMDDDYNEDVDESTDDTDGVTDNSSVSVKNEEGDVTTGSNNGGNELYETAEGAIDGNNNIVSRGSFGHTGRKVGNLKAKGQIKFGG